MKETKVLDHFDVAGVNFRRSDFRRAEVVNGDVLSLEPEPENPHDSGAIKVLKSGIHIGYVPRTHTDRIRQLESRGSIKCVVADGWVGGVYAEIFEA